MRYKPTLLHVVLMTIPIVLSGCSSPSPGDIKAFLRPDEADVTSDTYILQPPDVITVLSSKVPEMQRSASISSVGLTQQIRPDGKISLESIGDIMVAGNTPRQVLT